MTTILNKSTTSKTLYYPTVYTQYALAITGSSNTTYPVARNSTGVNKLTILINSVAAEVSVTVLVIGY